jgi:hypothetical protein
LLDKNLSAMGALMATDTQKYGAQVEQEPRHSALAEFSRDERRPAVLLLSALALSVIFFGIGLLVGRWTAMPTVTQSTSSGATSTTSPPSPTPQPTASPVTNAAGETTPNATPRRFVLLVATYDAPEKAQALIKTLQEAGYADARTSNSRAGETRPRYSVILGHFTQDEARQEARRMRSSNDPRLKNAKVIEDGRQ